MISEVVNAPVFAANSCQDANAPQWLRADPVPAPSARKSATHHHRVFRHPRADTTLTSTMAKQIPAHILKLPAHLSHKSALVLLPPSDIIAPIELLRRVYDKQFDRWPPHINLLYPFLANAGVRNKEDGGTQYTLKNEIRMRIARAVQDIAPFHMSLPADAPSAFHHSERSYSVWLRPTTQNIQGLHAALQTEFYEVNHDTRPFTPHLSVGQTRSQIGVEKLNAKVEKTVSEFLSKNGAEEGSPIALDWPVDRVCVIERGGFKDRFQVVAEIELEKERS